MIVNELIVVVAKILIKKENYVNKNEYCFNSNWNRIHTDSGCYIIKYLESDEEDGTNENHQP